MREDIRLVLDHAPIPSQGFATPLSRGVLDYIDRRSLGLSLEVEGLILVNFTINVFDLASEPQPLSG